MRLLALARHGESTLNVERVFNRDAARARAADRNAGVPSRVSSVRGGRKRCSGLAAAAEGLANGYRGRR
jgi:hypothetical protein